MSSVDARTALTESFIPVTDDRSREILRIVGPHDLYVGIAGFKTSSLNVTGNGVIVGNLTVSGTIYDGSGNAYSTGGGGGGGGAPTTARYVTLATDSTLTQERVLTAGTGITISDGGAGSSVTVALTTPVTVANGGTGGGDAATARTNLGVSATGADTTYAFRSSNLSDLSSASTARTNLGLGSIATQNSNNVSITGGSITVTKMSGSLTKLSDGSSYIIAGTNITVVTGSNGAVTISSAAGGSPGGVDNSVQYNSNGSFAGLSPPTSGYRDGRVLGWQNNSLAWVFGAAIAVTPVTVDVAHSVQTVVASTIEIV